MITEEYTQNVYSMLDKENFIFSYYYKTIH